MYLRYFKRPVDLVIALLGLIAASPVMLVAATAVRLFMGRPVLYLEQRPGLGEQPFTIMKFRTMRLANDPLEIDTHRLTPLGRFLRRTSLDELPQLWNILRGDMSLVGPRPLLWRYLPYYKPEERTRHNVRPGVTGWAQIHGRNEVNIDRRLMLDAWYVRNLSFTLDMRILLATFWMVLKRRGVQVDPGAAAPNLDVLRARS
jgi:lipopolysaccharide/colanic/teichoic acid biosynthesis glycosyltransferase